MESIHHNLKPVARIRLHVLGIVFRVQVVFVCGGSELLSYTALSYTHLISIGAAGEFFRSRLVKLFETTVETRSNP